MKKQHTDDSNPCAQKPNDLEIKNAQLIFDSVWADIEREYDLEKLVFPKEIFWLNGAPGAGKGTNTRFIIQYRDICEEPLVVSDLLHTPEAKKLIDAGKLVGDKEVIGLVFRKLLDPKYNRGVVVDGYPRSLTQVECLKLFHNKLTHLRAEHKNSPLSKVFRTPRFHIIVLFIDEKESIARQFKRGRIAREHNQEVKESGIGELMELRNTDISEEAAQSRYKVFKDETYEALTSLRKVFHYHFINAKGTIQEVQDRIIKELRYQSSLELRQNTYDRISNISLAGDIVLHARQQLIERLDDYEEHHTELFQKVIAFIEHTLFPTITRHAMSGKAQVNTDDPLLDDPLALSMLVDIFTERGFHSVIEIVRHEIPDSVDPKTFKIHTRVKKIHRIRIYFEGSDIRRG
ncbi:MAG: adenylate kinase [Verrucomicrobia bacterium GWF2_51_19]|nr:MAG: adenylate kinase [Verrucomicrobia bacterium GWF2_51_19]HCJ12102.1 adenylate kinase [Opitutae bacterium]